jgi:hypothetical protein
MSRRIEPTLFLGVTDRHAVPLAAPAFAAVHVTAALVRRLCTLARLCERQKLAWLATRDVEPPVYWDAPEERWTECSTLWHVVGTGVYAELTARPRVRGGYGALEVVGSTPVLDVSELRHLRAQKIVLDFREHEGQDDLADEPFALSVLARLRETGVWPR